MFWSDHQIREFAADIKRAHGHGWRYLVEDVQRALIDAKAFAVVRSQNAETVPVAAMDELRTKLHLRFFKEEG